MRPFPPVQTPVASDGAVGRIEHLREIMSRYPDVAALPYLSYQESLAFEPLQIGSGSLWNYIVTPGVRLDGVPCMRGLYCIS